MASMQQPEFEALSKQRNGADKSIQFYTEQDTSLQDFY
jgi:hypothetical protein